MSGNSKGAWQPSLQPLSSSGRRSHCYSHSHTTAVLSPLQVLNEAIKKHWVLSSHTEHHGAADEVSSAQQPM